MSQFRSNARMERVDRHWQATDAVVCGDVTIGDDCSLWFQTVIRGDVAPIRLGNRVNVQEHCVLHCDTGRTLEIGDDVTLGHGAVVHGSKVGRGTLDEQAVAEALASRQPALHGAVAPARGLCLRRVVLGRRTTERSREIREP